MNHTHIFILLQALRQAQVLSPLVYKIEKTVSLGHRMYTFDIDCSRKGYLCISASNNSQAVYFPSVKSEPDSILFTSPSGLYIALEEKGDGDELNFIYGTHHSVKQSKAILKNPNLMYKYDGAFSQRRKKTWQIDESYVLWGEDEDPVHRGCGSKYGFTPQGIAATKSARHLALFMEQ